MVQQLGLFVTATQATSRLFQTGEGITDKSREALTCWGGQQRGHLQGSKRRERGEEIIG
jgi:hypothetical protein